MKKLILFVMCLALAAGSAIAADCKYPDEAGPNNPEAVGRDLDYPCSPNDYPIEDWDNNNYCDSPDPTLLGCPVAGTGVFDEIYAWASETSDDWYRVFLPAHNSMVIRFRGCDGGLLNGVKWKWRNDACNYGGAYTTEDLERTNDTDSDEFFKIKVVRYNPNATLDDDGRCLPDIPYHITIECLPITDPCPPGTRDYCEDPILIPAGDYEGGYYHYNHVENTYFAMNIVEGIYEGGANYECGGFFNPYWASDRDVVYEMNLEQQTTIISLEVTIVGDGDTQVAIYENCAGIDEFTPCVLSSDQGYPYDDGELIENFTLPAGTYYIVTSQYGFDDECVDIELDIVADRPLPVELTGFEAISGDASVTLNWTTASETNSDRFDIVRDGTTVGRVTADNRATGSTYTWTEANLTNGQTYSYELIAVDFDGAMSTIAEASATPNFDAASVTEYALHQNYPNPFNPETNISFDLAEAGAIK
ncbi:hypothetical protein KKC97_06450, partial [bacterium]|nr:hypothetical protein [bacterium]